MKLVKKSFFICIAIAGSIFFTACKKDFSQTSEMDSATAAAIQAAVLQTQSIPVAVSSTNSSDSVYALHACEEHSKRDSISFTALPTVIKTYLSTNYSGFSFKKSFKILEHSGSIKSFIAIIIFNSNPVALKFDADGNFVKVLELREGKDLLGHGWHEGGEFEHRDGAHHDTIPLSAIPVAVSNYFVSHYPTDTLLQAFKTRDNGIVIISRNKTLFSTAFNASGTFIEHEPIHNREGHVNQLEQAKLPSSILNYLSTTYPGFVFEKAFSLNENNTIKGYCVIIDANNTKYAVQFDGNGTFTAVKILH